MSRVLAGDKARRDTGTQTLTDKPSNKKNVSSGQTLNAYLQTMIEDYQTPLLRYVGKLIGTGYDEAQDIVQEVFLRAYRKLESDGADSIDNLRSWLYRVAHNLAMDTGRRRGRRKKLKEKVMQDPVLTSSLTSDCESADCNLAKDEACKLAMQAVQDLPDEARNIVLLKIIQGMTLKEISSITGLKIGTVNYRLTQALSELSKRLKSAGAV